MPAQSQIHLIENDGRFVPIQGHVYESGYWAISRSTANRLVGGMIYFHAKKSTPSYFGGKVLSWRIQEEGEYSGRVVFRFEASPACKGVSAGKDGWGQEKKIVLDD